MGAQVNSGAGDAPASSGTSPRGAFALIWAYALASGLVAYGLTEVIAALTKPSYVRVPLQWATMPTVAVVAGLACESTLTRLRSLLASYRHD